MTLEFFLQGKNSDNWQLASARGYHLAQWAKTVCSVYYNSEDKEEIAYDDVTESLVDLLTKLFADPSWLETNRYVSLTNIG